MSIDGRSIIESFFPTISEFLTLQEREKARCELAPAKQTLCKEVFTSLGLNEEQARLLAYAPTAEIRILSKHLASIAKTNANCAPHLKKKEELLTTLLQLRLKFCSITCDAMKEVRMPLFEGIWEQLTTEFGKLPDSMEPRSSGLGLSDVSTLLRAFTSTASLFTSRQKHNPDHATAPDEPPATKEEIQHAIDHSPIYQKLKELYVQQVQIHQELQALQETIKQVQSPSNALLEKIATLVMYVLAGGKPRFEATPCLPCYEVIKDPRQIKYASTIPSVISGKTCQGHPWVSCVIALGEEDPVFGKLRGMTVAQQGSSIRIDNVPGLAGVGFTGIIFSAGSFLTKETAGDFMSLATLFRIGRAKIMTMPEAPPLSISLEDSSHTQQTDPSPEDSLLFKPTKSSGILSWAKSWWS